MKDGSEIYKGTPDIEKLERERDKVKQKYNYLKDRANHLPTFSLPMKATDFFDSEGNGYMAISWEDAQFIADAVNEKVENELNERIAKNCD